MPYWDLLSCFGMEISEKLLKKSRDIENKIIKERKEGEEWVFKQKFGIE